MVAKNTTIPWDAEHTEPALDDAAATQADDASVRGGSPGQAGATADSDGDHGNARDGTDIATKGMAASTMDSIQLFNWMEQMEASRETLEELQMSGTDESELMFCMDTGRQSTENIEMVENQLKLAGNPLLCVRLRQRLTSEAEDERQERDQARRMEVQAEKAKLECETMRMQHEMDMMRYEAAAL